MLCACVNACVLVRFLSVTTCNMHAIVVIRQLNYTMHACMTLPSQYCTINVMCITCMTRVPGHTVLL